MIHWRRKRDVSSINKNTVFEGKGVARAEREGWLLAALGVSAIPVLFLACYVYSFACALPINDQWSVAHFIVSVKEGHPSLPLLFSYHNEHLIVIPRLLFAGLALLFTWDNRAECWVTFLFIATFFGLLCRVVLKGRKKGEIMGLIALVLAAVFLFSTTQWQNWLCLLYTSDAADEEDSVDL